MLRVVLLRKLIYRVIIIDGIEAKYEDFTKFPIGNLKSLTTLDGDTGLKIYGKKGSKGVIIVETGKAQVVGNMTKEATFSADGVTDFKAWVQKRVKYLKVSINNNAEGAVVAEFYVEKDGRVNDVSIITNTTDKYIEDEMIRVVKASPLWNPAMDGNEPIRSKKRIMIVFTL